MTETLIVAGFTALVIGALMLGALGVQMKHNTGAIRAMHARLDALVIALAEHGIVSPGALAHLARRKPRDSKPTEGEAYAENGV